MKAKETFINLSQSRTGIMMNGKDFSTDNYIKKRHLSKEQSILRKTV